MVCACVVVVGGGWLVIMFGSMRRVIQRRKRRRKKEMIWREGGSGYPQFYTLPTQAHDIVVQISFANYSHPLPFLLHLLPTISPYPLLHSSPVPIPSSLFLPAPTPFSYYPLFSPTLSSPITPPLSSLHPHLIVFVKWSGPTSSQVVIHYQNIPFITVSSAHL